MMIFFCRHSFRRDVDSRYINQNMSVKLRLRLVKKTLYKKFFYYSLMYDVCSIIVKFLRQRIQRIHYVKMRSRYLSQLFSSLSLRSVLFHSWYSTQKKIVYFLQNSCSLCCRERDRNANDGCSAASHEELILSGRQQNGGSKAFH